jgi:hypothetical protein
VSAVRAAGAGLGWYAIIWALACSSARVATRQLSVVHGSAAAWVADVVLLLADVVAEVHSLTRLLKGVCCAAAAAAAAAPG